MSSPQWDAPEVLGKTFVWNGSAWVAMTQPGDVTFPDTPIDVHNHVWDTDTLAWVVQNANTGSGTGTDVNVTNFPTTQPISAVSLPLPADAATQTTLALIKAKTDNLDVALSTRTKPADTQAVSAASLPLPSGAATETTLGTRLTESDFDTKVGALTETAPATDTASSGLNGRLQRIAQRITSLITALGTPFQAGGSIGNTSFASTVADGANVNQGANADAVVAAGAAGTISAKLRAISRDIVANIVLAAGTAIIGKVGIDQTTPGTTNAVQANAGTNLNTSALALDASVTASKVSLTITALQVTASGDTTLVASGTRKIHRIEMSNSHATAAVTAGIKIASQNGGAVFGKKYLPAIGGAAVIQFAKGYINVASEAITANLSGAGQVEYTVYYE